MTHRDLFWRGLGAALVVVAATVRLADGAGTHTGMMLVAFLLTLIGLVLMIQGKRVPAALRVERSRHRLLAQAIRDRRRKRSGDGNA
ncbi:hypothetical protein [Sphingomonas sp. 10B4]|uniref:hypothetical protein n=1 Tax=Sphingomonas sp. 10B4 TaxID=3048575 RepID=UPI002AB341D3|nr:hypothetical protein [Sphingomonas sp. 10B4]MDY7524312.1 hypothetical protein [Sphingomonas sp. 10B4]MEB0282222.1 hypothetical protein [Sphingomonas sp. 10B4]